MSTRASHSSSSSKGKRGKDEVDTPIGKDTYNTKAPNKKHRDAADANDEEMQVTNPNPNPIDFNPMASTLFTAEEAKVVETTANKQYFNVDKLLSSDEDRKLSTTPYRGFFGEPPNMLHNDQASLSNTIARCVNQVPAGNHLPPDQLAAVKNNKISKGTILLVIAAIISKSANITNYVSPNNTDKAIVIISCLGYTEPSKILGAITGGIVPASLTAKLWYASKMAVGSQYVKVKDELKAARAAKIKGRQTTLTDTFKPIAAAASTPSTTARSSSPSSTTSPLRGVFQGDKYKHHTILQDEQNAYNKINPATMATVVATAANPTNTPPPNPDEDGKPHAVDSPNPITPTGKTNTNRTDAVRIATISLSTKKFAEKVSSTREHKSTRLQAMFTIKEAENKGANESAVALIKSLFKAMLANDPKTAMLPWLEADQTKLPAIHSLQVFPTKMSELRPYVDRLRPKSNSKNWTKFNFCHQVDPLHLTADDNSDISDWYDDNDGAAYLCTVQGSDDTVALGDFAYTGPFTDFHRLEQAIRDRKAHPGSLVTKLKMTTKNLIFGCRIKKNQQLTKLINSDSNTGGYIDWTMKSDMMVSMECHRGHAKALKQHLYMGFNKCFHGERIGQYNIRFIPADNMMRAGSSGDIAKTDSLMKHAAVVKSLKNITSTDFKDLDKTVKNMHGKDVCPREWLLNLTWPLIDAGEDPKLLFFSEDIATYGRNKGTGTYNVTAYSDIHPLATKVVDILVALFAYQHGRERFIFKYR